MSSVDPDAVSRSPEIVRLTARVRRLQTAVLALGLAFGATFALGQAAPQGDGAATPGGEGPAANAPPAEVAGGRVVEAERFVIRGPDGKPRAWIGTEKTGWGEAPAKALIGLADASGQMRIALSVDDEGTPQIELNDPTGKAGMRCRIATTGSFLTMRDLEGRDRAVIMVPLTGKPYLELRDEAGTPFFTSTH